MPRRIQRQRTKGWRMPPGVVYVGRPTVWGNRYTVGTKPGLGVVATAQEAVDGFRRMWSEPHQIAYIREQLAGKDLACWCPLEDQNGNPVPCHADVLLELANPERSTAVLHKDRHEMLHRKLDELIADFLTQHPDKRPSNTTVLELMQWSAAEARNPTGDGA